MKGGRGWTTKQSQNPLNLFIVTLSVENEGKGVFFTLTNSQECTIGNYQGWIIQE